MVFDTTQWQLWDRKNGINAFQVTNRASQKCRHNLKTNKTQKFNYTVCRSNTKTKLLNVQYVPC